jgi:protein PhnA
LVIRFPPEGFGFFFCLCNPFAGRLTSPGADVAELGGGAPGWDSVGRPGDAGWARSDGMSADDFIYDEITGEWIDPAQVKAAVVEDTGVVVRDSAGTVLADGDSVTLIKELKVKGAGQTLKRGTVIKSIKLTGDEQEIDCRFDGIKGLVLRAEFVRKM